mgnify:CR=1 FL=1
MTEERQTDLFTESGLEEKRCKEGGARMFDNGWGGLLCPNCDEEDIDDISEEDEWEGDYSGECGWCGEPCDAGYCSAACEKAAEYEYQSMKEEQEERHSPRRGEWS